MMIQLSTLTCLLAVICLASSLPLVHEHPEVPKSVVCDDSMKIGHEGSPETSEFPYEIAPLKSTVSPGESTNITISGKTPSNNFLGLLVVSRCNSEKAGSFVGSNLDKDKVKFYDCGNGEKSVALWITMDKQPRNEAVFEWVAPNRSADCSIDFYASVVQNYGTFWEKQKGNNPVLVKA